MALNNAEYIDGLNVSDPKFNDRVADCASHIRAIKKSLKQTFPQINASLDVGVDRLNGFESRIASLEASLGSFQELRVVAGRKVFTTATGNVSITGIGFQPSAVLLMVNTDDPYSGNFSGNYSVGFYDGTNEASISGTVDYTYLTSGDRTYVSDTLIADVYTANEQDAGSLTFASFDGDGFTVTKAGSYEMNCTWVAFE